MRPARRASLRFARSSASRSPSRAATRSCAWRAAAASSTTRCAASMRAAAGPASTTPDRCRATTSSCWPATSTATPPSVASRRAATWRARSSTRSSSAALVEAALDEARGHLFGLSGCRNGEVPRRLLAGERDAALAAARTWARPLCRRRLRRSSSATTCCPTTTGSCAELAALADEAGLPTVVTNEVHYADPTGIGSRTCSSASATARRSTRRASCCCRTPSTGSRRALSWRPSARRCRTSAAVAPGRRAWRAAPPSAEACRLELGFERYRFPGFSVPEGETAFSYLYQLAHHGLLPVTGRLPSRR